MSTYSARHATVEVEASPQRRLLMRGSLATAAATAIAGVGFMTPAAATPIHPTIRLGSRNVYVRELQLKLRAGGYSPGVADGIFGSMTRSALMAMQRDYHLVVDGICGGNTWNVVHKLGSSTPPSDPPPTTTTTLRPGDRGSDVKALQVRLLKQGYWHSGSDGVYGQTTQQAVMAVQKVYRLPRTGVADPATRAQIDRMGRKVPRDRSGTVIEIELDRQIMLFVVNGRTKWVFNTSTGAAGWRTPRGKFRIFRQINGMRYAPLGELWRPKYFNGGIALHGSPSIPAYAASHGCARLSNAAINYVWSSGLAPIGHRVWVY
ncbi:MAG: L,D-transpeptidase family protein [Janibacter sp.]|nr:L,D-transpeptidase family protein [Janibacter sp.]